MQTLRPLMRTVQLFLLKMRRELLFSSKLRPNPLNPQFLAQNHALFQQPYSFGAFSTAIQSCTFTRPTCAPVNLYYSSTLQCDIGTSNLFTAFIILALNKFPPTRRFIFRDTKLLHVSRAFFSPMHTSDAKV